MELVLSAKARGNIPLAPVHPLTPSSLSHQSGLFSVTWRSPSITQNFPEKFARSGLSIGAHEGARRAGGRRDS
jgi:hypothetical protein